MLRLLIGVFRDQFRSQASLEAEIVALRHQVAVLHRRVGRRKLQLTWADRALLVLVSRVWSGWRDAVFIVQPETVLRSGTAQVSARTGVGKAGLGVADPGFPWKPAN